MLSKNNEGATRDCIFVCVGEESEVNSSHLNKDNKTAEELFAAANEQLHGEAKEWLMRTTRELHHSFCFHRRYCLCSNLHSTKRS